MTLIAKAGVIIGGAVFVGFVLFTVVTVVVATRVSSQCLSAGYPSGRIDYAYNGYCIKRVNQTDVVVPLAEVQRP